VVEVDGLKLSAGGKQLLDGASLVIERAEHIALVGPNGSGKTTLLETLMENRPADAGAIRFGHGVEPAYFSQHEVELDERGTVLDCAVAMTGLARPQAQHLLGKFLFSGYAEQEKQVSVLSGGERRRLALAAIVASGANLLVLDEPTNHLDLESREALEAALEAFPGSILLVSHDRALLDAVAERTIAVEDHTLHSYEGGWADLVQAREERVAAPPVAERAPKQPRPPRATPKKKGPTELEQVERRITTLEQHVAQLEAKLAEDWTNMDTLTEYRTSRDELQDLLVRWEALFEGASAETQAPA
jgi:ATP-binding cassette subfamily F protein 3